MTDPQSKATTVRDPRIEPETGDIIQLGSLGKLEVVRNSGETVYWRYYKARWGEKNLFKWPIANWLRTMKSATIINTAPERE